ncbi:MAG TPA: DUF1707 domain-containing protein [Streptosporangiaceae bacterium]|nr:DUF1707 domain-containing protein [Streptosporangiaceae bacterium]
MRASDADRDAVLADLSEHFQAGRLTAEELEERTGQTLAARTWGELEVPLADLPATRPAFQAPADPSSGARPWLSSGRVTALVFIGIAAVLVVGVAHVGWGLIWMLLPVLWITRRLNGPGAPWHHGQEN